jgi:hypothetical protein
VLPINFAFSYKMYRLTGAPPTDATPRYYFPIALALIPASACWSIERLNPTIKRILTWVILFALVVGPAWMAMWSAG